MGQNDLVRRSSPVQVGSGTDWSTSKSHVVAGKYCVHATKTDGTAWVWGWNAIGSLGLGDQIDYSSPVQLPGTTWGLWGSTSDLSCVAIKTDGTMWAMGYNDNGQLGQNNTTNYSSPKQIPGTTWSYVSTSTNTMNLASKTDGTVWTLSLIHISEPTRPY